MFCHARGFVHTNCNECDSMFYPLSASPPDDDSSGIAEEQEEHDPALNHVRYSIMASFNTDRVSDNDARDFLFLASLSPHRATSGQEDFLGPARPPSEPDVPAQVVMEEERTKSGKRHGHYNAAAVCDVTTLESIAEQLP